MVSIEFDEITRRFITESLELNGALDLVAHRHQTGDAAEYQFKETPTTRAATRSPAPTTSCSWRST
ncbi:hypothetical protein [Paractinoplanes hotanensis]|uniref:Uncharacterized protein n=1 Tax=Paractinoplanes hotanensis TaxID=2906497 RepID=A0ABT0YEH1_9ACTN|nr:hypothetical protein [Actinoplanes hotanensis]MCM4084155.1 hypothetical protein [Actinoplanes hotanensis]